MVLLSFSVKRKIVQLILALHFISSVLYVIKAYIINSMVWSEILESNRTQTIMD